MLLSLQKKFLIFLFVFRAAQKSCGKRVDSPAGGQMPTTETEQQQEVGVDQSNSGPRISVQQNYDDDQTDDAYQGQHFEHQLTREHRQLTHEENLVKVFQEIFGQSPTNDHQNLDHDNNNNNKGVVDQPYDSDRTVTDEQIYNKDHHHDDHGQPSYKEKLRQKFQQIFDDDEYSGYDDDNDQQNMFDEVQQNKNQPIFRDQQHHYKEKCPAADGGEQKLRQKLKKKFREYKSNGHGRSTVHEQDVVISDTASSPLLNDDVDLQAELALNFHDKASFDKLHSAEEHRHDGCEWSTNAADANDQNSGGSGCGAPAGRTHLNGAMAKRLEQNQNSDDESVDESVKKILLVYKFDELKTQYIKDFSKFPSSETQAKIAKKIGTCRTRIYQYKKQYGLTKTKRLKHLKKKYHQLIEQFEAIKRNISSNNFVKGHFGALDKKTAKKIGTSQRSIKTWKRKLGDTYPRFQYSDNQKSKLIEQYELIRKKHPEMAKSTVAKMLNFHWSTYSRWKREKQKNAKKENKCKNGIHKHDNGFLSADDPAWAWYKWTKKVSILSGDDPAWCWNKFTKMANQRKHRQHPAAAATKDYNFLLSADDPAWEWYKFTKIRRNV